MLFIRCPFGQNDVKTDLVGTSGGILFSKVITFNVKLFNVLTNLEVENLVFDRNPMKLLLLISPPIHLNLEIHSNEINDDDEKQLIIAR